VGNETKRLFTLITLLAVTLAGARIATRYHASQKRHPDWSVVPYEVDSWLGRDAAIDPIFGIDPADSSLVRRFQNGDKTPIILYVGFYGDLGSVMQFHSPEICYPSQGWSILRLGYSPSFVYRKRSLRPQEAVVEKDGSRRLVIWWYSAGSSAFENRIRYVYATLMLGSISGRTDGSLVRIEAPFGKDSEEEARKRVLEFQSRIVPKLDKALP